jgi:hypothetical protein
MSDWFTIQTLVAFILGVILAAQVKSLTAKAKGKV